jgi:hypothetical protein
MYSVIPSRPKRDCPSPFVFFLTFFFNVLIKLALNKIIKLI